MHRTWRHEMRWLRLREAESQLPVIPGDDSYARAGCAAAILTKDGKYAWLARVQVFDATGLCRLYWRA